MDHHQISEMNPEDILQNITEGNQQGNPGGRSSASVESYDLSRMNRRNTARLPDPPQSRRTGKCKFFNCTTGFGFIYDRGSTDGTEQPIDVDIFFHWTDIAASEPPRPDGGMPFRSLAVNETVEYKIERGKAGYCAKDITGPRRARVRGFGLMANRLVYPKPQGQQNGQGNDYSPSLLRSPSGNDLAQQLQLQQQSVFANGLNGMNALSGMNGMSNGMGGLRPFTMNDFQLPAMPTRINNPGVTGQFNGTMQQPLQNLNGQTSPNNFYGGSPGFGTFNSMGFPQQQGLGTTMGTTGGFGVLPSNFAGGMVAPYNSYNANSFDYSSVTGSPNPGFQGGGNFDNSSSSEDMSGMGIMSDGSELYRRGRGNGMTMGGYAQGM